MRLLRTLNEKLYLNFFFVYIFFSIFLILLIFIICYEFQLIY